MEGHGFTCCNSKPQRDSLSSRNKSSHHLLNRNVVCLKEIHLCPLDALAPFYGGGLSFFSGRPAGEEIRVVVIREARVQEEIL